MTSNKAVYSHEVCIILGSKIFGPFGTRTKR